MEAVKSKAEPRPGRKARAAARPLSPARRRLRLALRILMYTGLGLLVVTALAAATIAAVFWYYGRGLDSIELKSLADYHPKQVTRIVDHDGQRIGEIFTERRHFLRYDQVPQIMVDSFVVAEDAGFWEHSGVDYRGMVRAFFTNVRSGKTKQGASTITQQVVKTLVLSPQRTFKRKVQEIILAKRLEKALTKKEILTLYMNQIYFGHGRYGVDEAARFYFGKPVAEVTPGEAALLAGLPQSPENISPLKNPRRAKDRQTYVLNQLARHGKISAAEAQKWIDAPIAVVRRPFPRLGTAPEWIEVVRKELIDAYGETGLDTLGAEVQITMAPDLQAAAQDALRKALRAHDARHKAGRPIRKVDPAKTKAELGKLARQLGGRPRAGKSYQALVTQVFPADHEVVVDLGGWQASLVVDGPDDERWNPPDDDGKRKPADQRFAPGDVIVVALPAGPRPGEDDGDQPEVTHAPNRVVMAPGAEGAVVVLDPHTRKVLALVGGYQPRAGDFNRALSAHRQPGSAFKPIVYAAALDSKRFTPASIVNDAPEVYDLWKPQNYKKGAFEGPVRLRRALARSINTVAIKVLHDIGPDAAADLAHRLGLTGDLPRTLSLALGSGEATPLEMTNAFATFAAGGQWAAPSFVARVDGADRAPASVEQVLAPEVAYVITDMMRSVVEEGTATKARALKLNVAGKTGTSNDARDAWFVGMTPDIVIGVWIGYDDNRPLGSHEAGGVTALPAFIDTIKAVAPAKRSWPVPPGVDTARIDKQTGLLAAPGAPSSSAMDEVFVAGTAPTEVAPLPGQVDATSFVTDEYGDEVPAPDPDAEASSP